MVWHEAVGPDNNVVSPAPFGHQGEIRRIVVITKKGFHSPVAALGNVMGNSGGDDACYSWHVNQLHLNQRDVKINRDGVPRGSFS